MKYLFAPKKICAIIFLFALTAFPQQDSKYFDAPFGGGGGYTPGWYIPNLKPINERVKAFGLSGLSESGFYTSGGAGFIYIGFVPGLRIGGMGFGGSTSDSKTQGGLNKEVIYSLSGGGVTVEYSLPFIRNAAVSLGAIIGGGTLQVEIYENADSYDWDFVWPGNGATVLQDVSRTIKDSYWFVAPTLNIDIPVYRFITFRLGAGYQVSIGDDWTLDNERELKNIPSDANGNSFFIQSGIFIGFFSF